jgi:hypothetical protein
VCCGTIALRASGGSVTVPFTFFVKEVKKELKKVEKKDEKKD